MKSQTTIIRTTLFALLLAGPIAAASCVVDPVEDCQDALECASGSTSGGSAGDGGAGGDAGAGAMGGGPSTGGGGQGGSGGCIVHADCTDADNAQCNNMQTCVPCTEDEHCEGVAGLGVCDAGTCVECTVDDDTACTAQQTCNLLDNTCTGEAPGTVLNCQACTNDLQCQSGHACIQMDFEMQHHGYYCLEEVSGACSRPFQVAINKPSISGAAATNYCGIEEDLATCEAVNAHLLGWVCSGTDGMCSPDGIAPEQPVPGALCEQVGVGGDACTYACDATPQCPPGAPQNTCGNGDNTPPGWCGG